MSAHKESLGNLESILFWQPIWQLLVQQNFDLVPPDWPERSNLTCKRWFIPTASGGQIRDQTDTFESALKLAFDLQKALKKKYRQILTEWNYLGNSQERDVYISYLSRYFWENQSEEFLLSRPDYALLIAENFKICKWAEDPSINLDSAINYMSSKSREFLLKLENSLSDWELNPFLIHNTYGSFHWLSLVDEEYTMTGSIHKSENGFEQIIELDSTAGLSDSR